MENIAISVGEIKMKQFKIAMTVTTKDNIQELDVRDHFKFYAKHTLTDFTDNDAIYVERIK